MKPSKDLMEYLPGKTIVPFCTHGGGGQASVLKDITRLCPGSTVPTECVVIYGDGGSGARANVSVWLNKAEIEC